MPDFAQLVKRVEESQTQGFEQARPVITQALGEMQKINQDMASKGMTAAQREDYWNKNNLDERLFNAIKGIVNTNEHAKQWLAEHGQDRIIPILFQAEKPVGRTDSSAHLALTALSQDLSAPASVVPGFAPSYKVSDQVIIAEPDGGTATVGPEAYAHVPTEQLVAKAHEVGDALAGLNITPFSPTQDIETARHYADLLVIITAALDTKEDISVKVKEGFRQAANELQLNVEERIGTATGRLLIRDAIGRWETEQAAPSAAAGQLLRPPAGPGVAIPISFTPEAQATTAVALPSEETLRLNAYKDSLDANLGIAAAPTNPQAPDSVNRAVEEHHKTLLDGFYAKVDEARLEAERTDVFKKRSGDLPGLTEGNWLSIGLVPGEAILGERDYLSALDASKGIKNGTYALITGLTEDGQNYRTLVKPAELAAYVKKAKFLGNTVLFVNEGEKVRELEPAGPLRSAYFHSLQIQQEQIKAYGDVERGRSFVANMEGAQLEAANLLFSLDPKLQARIFKNLNIKTIDPKSVDADHEQQGAVDLIPIPVVFYSHDEGRAIQYPLFTTPEKQKRTYVSPETEQGIYEEEFVVVVDPLGRKYEGATLEDALQDFFDECKLGNGRFVYSLAPGEVLEQEHKMPTGEKVAHTVDGIMQVWGMGALACSFVPEPTTKAVALSGFVPMTWFAFRGSQHIYDLVEHGTFDMRDAETRMALAQMTDVALMGKAGAVIRIGGDVLYLSGLAQNVAEGFSQLDAAQLDDGTRARMKREILLNSSVGFLLSLRAFGSDVRSFGSFKPRPHPMPEPEIKSTVEVGELPVSGVIRTRSKATARNAIIMRLYCDSNGMSPEEFSFAKLRTGEGIGAERLKPETAIVTKKSIFITSDVVDGRLINDSYSRPLADPQFDGIVKATKDVHPDHPSLIVNPKEEEIIFVSYGPDENRILPSEIMAINRKIEGTFRGPSKASAARNLDDWFDVNAKPPERRAAAIELTTPKGLSLDGTISFNSRVESLVENGHALEKLYNQPNGQQQIITAMKASGFSEPEIDQAFAHLDQRLVFIDDGSVAKFDRLFDNLGFNRSKGEVTEVLNPLRAEELGVAQHEVFDSRREYWSPTEGQGVYNGENAGARLDFESGWEEGDVHLHLKNGMMVSQSGLDMMPAEGSLPPAAARALLFDNSIRDTKKCNDNFGYTPTDQIMFGNFGRSVYEAAQEIPGAKVLRNGADIEVHLPKGTDVDAFLLKVEGNTNQHYKDGIFEVVVDAGSATYTQAGGLAQAAVNSRVAAEMAKESRQVAAREALPGAMPPGSLAGPEARRTYTHASFEPGMEKDLSLAALATKLANDLPRATTELSQEVKNALGVPKGDYRLPKEDLQWRIYDQLQDSRVYDRVNQALGGRPDEFRYQVETRKLSPEMQSYLDQFKE